MKARNAQTSASRVNTESNQVLTRVTRRTTEDRPADGALSPARGTIEAPVVVVGATGTIGKALVRLLVASGQPVVAVAPQSDRLAQLREVATPGAVTPIVGRIESSADAKRLADRLRALARPLAGVVVTFPHGPSIEIGADRGRLLDQSTECLCECLEQTVLAQHALARHLIPLLVDAERNARYVIVGGPGSETPWAGYGHRSVAMAATRMLARVLHDEARACGVRVQLLSIDSPVRSEQPGDHECPEWPAASDVARSVARLVDPRSSDEPTDAIVRCGRSGAVRANDRVTRRYSDVPSLLESLRNPTNNITPQ
ncbi:MAG TPA: SDR family NAD(P)-dependent oxidoreductase [Steroidobacteraceae bacterium]|nr:SDR family NAD(P)-dependent oxidoreductase [Steroidobacteraceae bacterium]